MRARSAPRAHRRAARFASGAVAEAVRDARVPTHAADEATADEGTADEATADEAAEAALAEELAAMCATRRVAAVTARPRHVRAADVRHADRRPERTLRHPPPRPPRACFGALM